MALMYRDSMESSRHVSGHDFSRAQRLLGRVRKFNYPITRLHNYSIVQRGFTLIEMMIVISIIMILTSIAVPIYNQHLLHAREAVLKEDLHSMRESIDQYTQDKNKAPQSLDDLVSAGYMRMLPKDPFTNSNTSWEPVTDDTIMVYGQTDSGITDVHSGSKQVSSEGTAYDTW